MQIWNTNIQLMSSASGWISPQIHPMAEPTKRCSKSRRTNWKSRLRRSTRFRTKNAPGIRLDTIKLNNTNFFNNLQGKLGPNSEVDIGMSRSEEHTSEL